MQFSKLCVSSALIAMLSSCGGGSDSPSQVVLLDSFQISSYDFVKSDSDLSSIEIKAQYDSAVEGVVNKTIYDGPLFGGSSLSPINVIANPNSSYTVDMSLIDSNSQMVLASDTIIASDAAKKLVFAFGDTSKNLYQFSAENAPEKDYTTEKVPVYVVNARDMEQVESYNILVDGSLEADNVPVRKLSSKLLLSPSQQSIMLSLTRNGIELDRCELGTDSDGDGTTNWADTEWLVTFLPEGKCQLNNLDIFNQ
ncbi:hypothetical protein [Agarivorans sp. 1_MG-2023]|uniref:hypothetical protein n=1 Tax=Agarivorans sp. 1_MG-2023 TaxID=3062634 RepID=UPI0026E131D5|nr:hypothetical protein [Agarivorans sp. 1_MG-2023]MDO6762772.1 hypothetical protein [Agarivorans sp. 1_MG-2023]